MNRPYVSEQHNDSVNPSHYRFDPPVKEVADLTDRMGFNDGNAVKYILRAGRKAGQAVLQEAEKAAWYVNRWVAQLRGAIIANNEEPPLSGSEFHDLAMRTAAPRSSWHIDDQDTAQFARDLRAFITAARQIDRWKSALIYGKEKDESKFDRLPDHDTWAKLDLLDPEVTHALLGIASESGELIEHLLWNLNGSPLNAGGINEETGDVDWFQELLAKVVKRPVDQSRLDVIEKLRKRFPDRYTQEHAVARLDKVDVTAGHRIESLSGSIRYKD